MNPYFSGDGLTKTTGKSDMVAAGQHGTLETITLERNPVTITELQQRENSPVRRLVATPIA